MSLRNDIHSAFDDIAPSTLGLPERVLHSARADHRSRTARFVRLRAPMSLVAVTLLIALVAGVLIGGHVLQDWNTLRNASQGNQLHKSDFSSQLAELEARPLNLPTLSAFDPCPAIGRNQIGFDYGAGPVYVDGELGGKTAWGQYWTVLYLISPGVSGPVLVRGRDLKGDGMVVFIGDYASGAVVGTDGPAGPISEHRAELVLRAGDPRSGGASTAFGSFEVIQGIA